MISLIEVKLNIYADTEWIFFLAVYLNFCFYLGRD